MLFTHILLHKNFSIPEKNLLFFLILLEDCKDILKQISIRTNIFSRLLIPSNSKLQQVHILLSQSAKNCYTKNGLRLKELSSISKSFKVSKITMPKTYLVGSKNTNKNIQQCCKQQQKQPSFVQETCYQYSSQKLIMIGHFLVGEKSKPT